MGSNQGKHNHYRHSRIKKHDTGGAEESFDPNRKIKERACYDILMRTNRDKPRPPRDPNQPYDSVKSNEVLIQPSTIRRAFSDAIDEENVNPDTYKGRRDSKDEWMLRVKGHIENSEAMKDSLQFDSYRIRNSYQHKMSNDSEAHKKGTSSRHNKHEKLDFNTDDDEAKKSLEYSKTKTKRNKHH